MLDTLNLIKKEASLYADDTVIYNYARHPYTLYTILQKHIENCINWCTQCLVKLNGQKTAVIYFSKKLTYFNHFAINNSIIPWINYTKYLGVTLDRRLTWNKYFLNITGKVGLFHLYSDVTPSLLKIKYSFIMHAFTQFLLMFAHNKNCRIIRNGHRYLRNTTILRDLCTTSLALNFFSLFCICLLVKQNI